MHGEGNEGAKLRGNQWGAQGLRPGKRCWWLLLRVAVAVKGSGWFLKVQHTLLVDWMCCHCLVAELCLTVLWPHSQPGSSIHGISQQQYWHGLLFPPPRDLPDPEIEPKSSALHCIVLQADSSLLRHWSSLKSFYSILQHSRVVVQNHLCSPKTFLVVQTGCM